MVVGAALITETDTIVTDSHLAFWHFKSIYGKNKPRKRVNPQQSPDWEFCRPANHVLSKHRKKCWRAYRSGEPYRHSQPSMRLNKRKPGRRKKEKENS